MPSTRPPGRRAAVQYGTNPVGDKIIGGGAWNPPAIGPDGTVNIGTGNMYQPASVALNNPGKRLYTDSLLALDGTREAEVVLPGSPERLPRLGPAALAGLRELKRARAGRRGRKMGYVYALDAKTGKLVWKRKVGVHNGRDQDNLLALQHKLKLTFPLVVEPGIVGGVETNMAVADGDVYVPVANLASEWKTRETGLGSANFGDGKGELLALDLNDGHVLWDTKLPQMADGDTTVVNDLVITTTFDGYLVALKRSDGSLVWKEKLPAFTNAPVAIDGDTLITAASFPGGKGQTTEVIAFQLGANGSLTPTTTSTTTTTGGAANCEALFSENCASCHTLAAANATGKVGPNLDDLKPSKERGGEAGDERRRRDARLRRPAQHRADRGDRRVRRPRRRQLGRQLGRKLFAIVDELRRRPAPADAEQTLVSVSVLPALDPSRGERAGACRSR